MDEKFGYLLELDYNELVEKKMFLEHYSLDMDDKDIRDDFLKELGIVKSLIKEMEDDALSCI